MKVILAGCALGLIAASASATPVSRTVTINGVVDKFCKMDGVLAAGQDSDPVQVNGNSATIQNFADANGVHPGKLIQLKIPAAICNGTTNLRLSLANGALINTQVGDEAGWARRVTYLVTAAWDGIDVTLLGDGTPQNLLSSGKSTRALTTDLVIELTTDQGSLPLQGGTYTESLTVALEPAL